MAEIIYQLTKYTDSPYQSDIVWLTEDDMEKLNKHLVFAGQKPGSEDWLKKMYQANTARYCLLYYNGLPVARGAVEPYCEHAWEAADIRTVKEYRGRGFAKEILRFLSQYIIDHGKIATCRTEEENYAMQKVIKAINYKELGE